MKKVAKFTDSYVKELLQNDGIIRNKLKIKSAVASAKAFLQIQKEFGSFDVYLFTTCGIAVVAYFFLLVRAVADQCASLRAVLSLYAYQACVLGVLIFSALSTQ